MRRTNIRLMMLCLATLAVSSSGRCQDQTGNVIFLVRHAEKASQAHDAPLSIQGRNRSACLARMLRDANIQEIYVTEFARTQQTAQPLATALRITPKIVAASDIESVVSGSIKAPAGVLIVGHSDTIPAMVAKLTGKTIGIDDTEYDKLILVMPAESHAVPVVLRYCEAATVP